MKLTFLMKYVLGALTALSLALSLQAQVVTSGMTGLVRDATGKPLSGVTVTAVHTPTGTTYQATTNEAGRYNFRGMIPGGPYTVSAASAGMKAAEAQDLSTQLGADIDASFMLQPADVVTMERFVVGGAINDLDSSAAGAGSLLSSDRLSTKPTTARSMADLISASSFVTLRSTFGDREESQITALGQNNRYNSIQIDGSRINDQFGLNGTGLASFFNPISLDTLEQLSVQVSPYDVRLSGFTGASINAVTKSGTNQFRGSAYYYFSGDEWMGVQLQGEDINTLKTTGVRNVPKLERITRGFTLGGPIWRDRIFFFLNYEDFTRTAPPSDTGMPTVDSTQLSQIKSAFSAYNTASGKNISWGEIPVGALNVTEEKKRLGKIDWNINKNHRATLRYSTTEGRVPQFGSFVSNTRTNTSTVPSLSANAVTALDSNFYAQVRQERNVTAQIFSQWSPDFKTELKWGSVSQPQDTPTVAVAPEVTIYGVTGTTRNGVATNTGAIVAGTDAFRQANYISANTKQYNFVGDYFWRDFVISGGVEREESDFLNVFRSNSYGLITFANVADFVADRPARFDRSGYDPSLRPAADLSDFATTGIFGQVKWNINPRLSVMGGLRYEFAETKKKPALYQRLLTESGFRNDGTMDGASYISPRLAFNWSVDEARTMQLRGGIGHFLGRTPWVFFSNSYNRIGVGDFTLLGVNNPGQGSFANYLRTFDQANPIGQGTDNPTLRREVDWADPGVKMPSVWRGNIGFDQKLPFLDSRLTVEFIHTKIDKAMFISNENIRATTIGADGRQRFAGNPSTAANAKYAAYTDLYRIRNVSVGQSTFGTISLSRPIKNKWGFDLSYTRGRSTEAQAIGQTTASGQWQRNVIFNQGNIEVGTSDFEVKNRVLFSGSRTFELFKRWEFMKGQRTLVSFNYEGRSGNPFSWIYSNDLNGDGQSNDTVAVPRDGSDPRFDFSSLNATQLSAYLDFFKSSGLSRYAGGAAPKNAFRQPWINKLDLHVSQYIPLHYRNAELEVFFDWINFGSFLSADLFNYYQEAFRITNDVFRRQFVGPAVYGNDGRIIPQRSAITGATSNVAPDGFIFDNGQSRWKIQLGARLKF